jgi:hypothetical protein
MKPERYQAMILLASWCALRFGELTELRRKDIDLAVATHADGRRAHTGVIRIRRAVVRVDGAFEVTTPKSEAGIRDVAIPPHLVPVLKTLFVRAGFAATVHEAEFDTLETEVLDPGSALYASSPDAVVLLPATNALRRKYHEAQGERGGFGEEIAQRFAALWDALKKNAPKAIVVHGNFVTPYERELGSFGLAVPESLIANVTRANANALGARHVVVDARHREAAFLARREPVAREDLGVDEDLAPVLVLRDVDDDEPEVPVDLRRREPDARGRIHRLEQVVDALFQRGVEHGDRSRLGAQPRIGIFEDRKPGHDSCSDSEC